MNYQKFASLKPEEQTDILLLSLDRLAEDHPALAVALIRREYEGENLATIAETMGVSVGAVSKRLARARQLLMGYVEKEYDAHRLRNISA